LLQRLTAPDLDPVLAGALLTAVRAKGLTGIELRGFARGMRALARKPELPAGPAAVDIVGTGGDRSGSLNLSTGAALVTAAAGQRVIKHGNRSVSSQAGSADVLEALASSSRWMKSPRGAASLPAVSPSCLPALPPGDEGDRTGTPGTGRAHSVQYPGAALQSG